MQPETTESKAAEARGNFFRRSSEGGDQTCAKLDATWPLDQSAEPETLSWSEQHSSEQSSCHLLQQLQVFGWVLVRKCCRKETPAAFVD